MRRAARAALRRVCQDDEGSAIVEFLGATLILLVPLVYMVLVLGELQGAMFAAEGAARDAARVAATGDNPFAADQRAVAAVDLALADQGFLGRKIELECFSNPCLAPGEEVTVKVTVAVPLPWVPSFIQDRMPMALPVESTRTASVDLYRGKSS